MYIRYLKRFFDLVIVVISIPFVIVISGLLVLFYLINIDLPIFFVQKRIGENCKEFSLYKFRTLKKSNTAYLWGQILRKYSLDELPQFLNVLKGEMSIIGPRPLLVEYLDYYSEEEKIRHSVKPGITGWAQVNGRNLLDWKSKFEFDLYYVKNLSFLLDLKILFLSFKTIFINKENYIGQEYRFKGNKL